MSSPPGPSGYELLRDAITSGALQPSQRLVEAELSETFGLSRAAVRTALVRLEQDGLVSHERHRGAKVRLVTEREAVEIVEARAALESLAVRSAALNATKDDVAELRGLLREMRSLLKAGDLLRVSDVNARLHRRLLEISQNETAIRLTSTLNSQLVRFQFRTILTPGRGPQSLAEHTAVVDAVAARDPDAAERAMRTHLLHVVETVRAGAEAPARVEPPTAAGTAAGPATRRVFATAIVRTSSSLNPASRKRSAMSARPSSTGGLKFWPRSDDHTVCSGPTARVAS